ncbi:hypothetical protein ONZ45_g9673 [Pleurotus djamor]|nr:hypothetical protein ONZ45_g9673 [Pleurotus djamor]
MNEVVSSVRITVEMNLRRNWNRPLAQSHEPNCAFAWHYNGNSIGSVNHLLSLTPSSDILLRILDGHNAQGKLLVVFTGDFSEKESNTWSDKAESRHPYLWDALEPVNIKILISTLLYANSYPILFLGRIK